MSRPNYLADTHTAHQPQIQIYLQTNTDDQTKDKYGTNTSPIKKNHTEDIELMTHFPLIASNPEYFKG